MSSTPDRAPEALQPAEPVQPHGTPPSEAERDTQHLKPDNVPATQGGVPQLAPRPSSERPADLSELPARIAHYKLLAELGRGGMGVVYLARDTRLQREVALKVIHGVCAPSGVRRTRFHTEAETAARLTHPNIVQVHEIGEWQGLGYLAMELVEGRSLQTVLAGQPQPPGQAAEWTAILAQAMHYAHEQGVLHRDLKPANILRADSGALKITDFGLAKWLEGSQSLTGTGEVVGTPQYMAPEQASGTFQELSVASDVYSLGVILYEMLTGRPPFRGANPLDTLALVRSREPVPPMRLQPKVPLDLQTICLKCLRKEPEQRYASAAALAADLGRFLNRRPILARPVGKAERAWKWVRRHPALAGLLLVSCLALAALASVGLTMLANAALHSQLRDSQRQEFEAATQDCLERLGDRCAITVDVLHALAAFFYASQTVEREEFDLFTRRFLDRHKFILALHWLPHVPADQRAGWEQQLGRAEMPGRQMTARNGQGTLVPAPPRPEHFPVLFIQPATGPSSLIGFDHASEPTRLAALLQAVETGEPVATALTQVFGPESGRPETGFLLYVPVYHEADLPRTAERRARLRGCVAVACSLNRLVGDFLEQSFAQRAFILRIADETDPARPHLVFPEAEAGNGRRPPPPATTAQREVRFAGRTWRLVCQPKAD